MQFLTYTYTCRHIQIHTHAHAHAHAHAHENIYSKSFQSFGLILGSDKLQILSFSFRFYYVVSYPLPFLNKKSQRHGSHISPLISWKERFSVCIYICVCVYMCVCVCVEVVNSVQLKPNLAYRQFSSRVRFKDELCGPHRDPWGVPQKKNILLTFEPQVQFLILRCRQIGFIKT